MIIGVISVRMNSRGQALVEFVLILPVLIFLLFLLVDFGRIMYQKNHLENKTDDIIMELEKGSSYDTIVTRLNEKEQEKVQLKLTYGSDNYLTIEVVGNTTLLTPGLNLILGNPYQTVVKRVVPYE